VETYTLRNVLIKANGNQIASLPEAVVNLDLDRIEVTVDEVPLSSDTMGLLNLESSETHKEIEVSGRVDSKTLVIKKAVLNGLTFDAKRGEIVWLRDISIMGLAAEWVFAK